MRGNPQPFETTLDELLRDLTQVDNDDGVDLPIDAGLIVKVQPVPGEMFEQSHTHCDDASLELHLTPVDAREFDERVDEYVEEVVNRERFK